MELENISDEHRDWDRGADHYENEMTKQQSIRRKLQLLHSWSATENLEGGLLETINPFYTISRRANLSWLTIFFLKNLQFDWVDSLDKFVFLIIANLAKYKAEYIQMDLHLGKQFPNVPTSI